VRVPVPVVGQEGEEHAHAHQRERGGKAQHDRHHHEREHQQAQVALVMVSARSSTPAASTTISAMKVRPNQSSLADLHRAPSPRATTTASSAAMSASFTLHHFLELLDVDFLHVVFTRGPGAVADALDAAHDLDDALQQQREARQRDHILEGVQRQRLGREGLLADRERFARVDPAGPGQRDDAGQEEDDVEHQVDGAPGCAAWKKP
jgi:hypothetical protein